MTSYSSTTSTVQLTATRTETYTQTITQSAPTRTVVTTSVDRSVSTTTSTFTSTTVIEAPTCSASTQFYVRIDPGTGAQAGTLQVSGQSITYSANNDVTTGQPLQLLFRELTIPVQDSSDSRLILAADTAAADGCSNIILVNAPSSAQLQCQVSQALGDIIQCSRTSLDNLEAITISGGQLRIGTCGGTPVRLTQVCTYMMATVNYVSLPCEGNNIQVFSDSGFKQSLGFISPTPNAAGNFGTLQASQNGALVVAAQSEQLVGFSLVRSGIFALQDIGGTIATI